MSEPTKSEPQADAAEPVAAQAATDPESAETAKPADTSGAQAPESEQAKAHAALSAELETAQGLAREREVQYVRLRADFDKSKKK